MRFILTLSLSFIVLLAQAADICSPDKNLHLSFKLVKGVPYYSLYAGNQCVLDSSRLGFELADQPDLKQNFSLQATDTLSFSETWKPVWGEVSEIKNHYNELCAHLSDDKGRLLNIRFRLYNDGVGFRYEFPRQYGLSYFFIKEELTEFNLNEDCQSYWIPGDYDSNEFTYHISKLSGLNSAIKAARQSMDSKTIIDNYSVQTPVLFKKNNGMYVNIHEAALVDYPGMSLTMEKNCYKFKANLTPDPKGYKGRIQSGFSTPWRTVIVSKDAAGILESKLILNLNEPCKLASTDWIKPMKYIGGPNR